MDQHQIQEPEEENQQQNSQHQEEIQHSELDSVKQQQLEGKQARTSVEGLVEGSSQQHPQQDKGSTNLSQKENPQKQLEQINDNYDVFDQQMGDHKQVQRFPIVLKILESLPFQIIINVLTVYALFGDDIRLMAFDNRADITFDAITIIAMILFTVEIIMNLMVNPDYFNSFFFYLDIISTVSLLLDMTIFSDAIGLSGNSAADTASLARAGRASKIGTKAGRVVRLVRMIRIVKLYKAASKEKAKEDQLKEKEMVSSRKKKKVKVHPSQTESAQNKPAEEAQETEFKESRVSKRLSDLTTKRVIILVLLLLLVMPFFSADYYFDAPQSIDFAVKSLQVACYSQGSTKEEIIATYEQILADHKGHDTPIAYFSTPFSYLMNYQVSNYNYLRGQETDAYSYDIDMDKIKESHPGQEDALELNQENGLILGVIDTSSVEETKALMSFFKTIFVCIVLTFGALMFSKDANDLALRPIERMIDKVNKIAKNPIQATEQALVQGEGEEGQYETIIIENAIIKIGMLLALGFGDAGSEIIASNMLKSGDVDPMLPGKKKCAIYGFCDIRNFTDATEVLQEDVMIFVNNIGEIVHSMVDRYQGAANKNIGDAFLLVWKMDQKQYTIQDDGNVTWQDIKYVNVLADCALISFMKIQAKINREPKILKYREDTRLSDRLPGYKVKMGFGLHIGWGIEGAIGSEFKIDASYLSPNVNMASRLEAATKQYGVPLLISSDLQQYFSDQVKKYSRQIDKVTVKGSKKPVGFYTVDMDCDDLDPSKNPIEAYGILTKQQCQGILREKRKYITELIENDEFVGEEILLDNKDLRMVLCKFNPEFMKTFGEGFQQYLDGNWGECKKILENAEKLKQNDGPIQTLMGVMQETQFKAPADWKGYRELTEK